MKKVIAAIVGIIVLLSVGVIVLYYFFPLKYEEEIQKYANEYNIDPYLVFSIINVESGFDKDAKSHKDARGLMQIREITGKWASDNIDSIDMTEEEYFNPDSNIKIGCWYISRLKIQYGDKIGCIIAAYNAGIGNVDKWILEGKDVENGDIPFKETKEYVQKVKNNMKVYKVLY